MMKSHKLYYMKINKIRLLLLIIIAPAIGLSQDFSDNYTVANYGGINQDGAVLNNVVFECKVSNTYKWDNSDGAAKTDKLWSIQGSIVLDGQLNSSGYAYKGKIYPYNDYSGNSPKISAPSSIKARVVLVNGLTKSETFGVVAGGASFDGNGGEKSTPHRLEDNQISSVQIISSRHENTEWRIQDFLDRKERQNKPNSTNNQSSNSNNDGSNTESSNTSRTNNENSSSGIVNRNQSNDAQNFINNQNAATDRQEQYNNQILDNFKNSIDSEGNIDPFNFVQSLPSATTKTEAYTNLITTGVTFLAYFLNSNKETEAIRLARYEAVKKQRWEKLKNGIGDLNSDNEKTGKWAYFYEGTSAPKSAGNYNNGKKDGIWESYNNQNYSDVMFKVIKEINLYKDDILSDKYFAESGDIGFSKELGLLSTEKFFNRQKGTYIIDSKGNKMEYGLWQTYNGFGVNISEGYYNLKGKKTGLWSYGYEFQENKVWYTRNYHIKSKVSYNDGSETGTQVFYHRNGKVYFELYHLDKEIRQVEYNNKGEIISDFKYEKESSIQFVISDQSNYNSFIQNSNRYRNFEQIIARNVVIDDDFFHTLNELNKLEFLSLSTMEINNNLLDNIKHLKNLEYLSFNYTNLQKIPISLGKLSNLKTLKLGFNNFRTLPNEFSGLTNLEVLDIHKNKLDIIPDFITELINLKKLDLSINLIETIPINFGNLKNLEVLNLGHNKIEELPNVFENLKTLKEVYLNNNNITNLPASFTKLKKLKVLVVDISLKRNSKDILKAVKKNNKIIKIKYIEGK
jgi:hypothetical protein